MKLPGLSQMALAPPLVGHARTTPTIASGMNLNDKYHISLIKSRNNNNNNRSYSSGKCGGPSSRQCCYKRGM